MKPHWAKPHWAMPGSTHGGEGEMRRLAPRNRRHASTRAPRSARCPAARRGKRICRNDSKTLMLCGVRSHFMDEWAPRHGRHNGSVDVARGPRVPMADHARFKYLLHLDGQTCSSRLEQLLVMGSLVLKEESGYHAFYHHLLKVCMSVWVYGLYSTERRLADACGCIRHTSVG
eukprot:363718-Chlamydomonas_euryale.AAC.8